MELNWVRKGKKTVFLAGIENTHAEQIAVAQSIKRLNELVPFFLGRRPGIEKCRQALQAVRLGKDEHGHGKQYGDTDGCNRFPGRAAEKYHADHNRSDAHGNGHIRLQHNEHANAESCAEHRQHAL